MRVELDNYKAQVGGKLTFAGVLVSDYKELFKNCNDSTQQQYNREYNAHILPFLKDRPIDELTLEDYEMVIARFSEKKDYEASTINHMRYLVRTVAEKAAEKNICQDVLYGTLFSLAGKEKSKDIVPKKPVQFAKQRRSLMPREECRLFDLIMTDPTQDGGRMGLALMFSLGLRNGEACALKFSDILEMDYYPGKFCAWITVSTKGRTNTVKAGGKTPNAPRKIPVPSALLGLLEGRRAFLRRLIEDGVLVLPEGMTIEDLPIACRSDYITNHRSEDLSAAGRAVLREIKFDEYQLACIDQELRDTITLSDMGVTEKDPTAYLLRRNFGTHLHILHLSEPEIQYIMGHEMEDEYSFRYDYSSEEVLVRIAKKMDKRPLLNNISEETVWDISKDDRVISANDMPSFTLRIQDPTPGKVMIQARSLEPGETIDVSIICEDDFEPIDYYLIPSEDYVAPRTVNIQETYHRIYEVKNLK